MVPLRLTCTCSLFFPIWGTCLGFETLAIYTAFDPLDALQKFGANDVSLPISFSNGTSKLDPNSTKMFCSMDNSDLLE